MRIPLFPIQVILKVTIGTHIPTIIPSIILTHLAITLFAILMALFVQMVPMMMLKGNLFGGYQRTFSELMLKDMASLIKIILSGDTEVLNGYLVIFREL